jgi:hypothetical protein
MPLALRVELKKTDEQQRCRWGGDGSEARSNQTPSAYRKSYLSILMVQATQDRAADEIPGCLDAARDWGILVQSCRCHHPCKTVTTRDEPTPAPRTDDDNASGHRLEKC